VTALSRLCRARFVTRTEYVHVLKEEVWGVLDVKEATKRAASEALALMLAIMAMLVIASIVFYWR
jgi:hypothetical protein